MYIIKRNGTQVEFNNEKIKKAIEAANAEVSKADQLSKDTIKEIVADIEKVVTRMDRAVNVEEIQERSFQQCEELTQIEFDEKSQVKYIGDFAFKRESLGGGDIKLSFVVGLILGLRLGLCALILSTFLAFPYAFLNLFLGQKKEVPFGPFIISACAIIYVFLPKFVNLLNYLFIYIM